MDPDKNEPTTSGAAEPCMVAPETQGAPPAATTNAEIAAAGIRLLDAAHRAARGSTQANTDTVLQSLASWLDVVRSPLAQLVRACMAAPEDGIRELRGRIATGYCSDQAMLAEKPIVRECALHVLSIVIDGDDYVGDGYPVELLVRDPEGVTPAEVRAAFAPLLARSDDAAPHVLAWSEETGCLDALLGEVLQIRQRRDDLHLRAIASAVGQAAMTPDLHGWDAVRATR